MLVCRLSGARGLMGLELSYSDNPRWSVRFTRTCWIVGISLLMSWIGLRVPSALYGLVFNLVGQVSVSLLVIRACLSAVHVGGTADVFAKARLPGSVSHQFDLGLKVAYGRLLTALPVVFANYYGMRLIYPDDNPIAVGTSEHLVAAMFPVSVLPVFWLGELLDGIVAFGQWSVVIVLFMLGSLGSAAVVGFILVANHPQQSELLIITGITGGLGWIWYLSLRLICRRWW